MHAKAFCEPRSSVTATVVPSWAALGALASLSEQFEQAPQQCGHIGRLLSPVR